jgi:hypothetical protein
VKESEVKEVRKRFFFEKKAPRLGKQKTFGPAGAGSSVPQPAISKSFLLLFFKKEALSSLAFFASNTRLTTTRGPLPCPC